MARAACIGAGGHQQDVLSAGRHGGHLSAPATTAAASLARLLLSSKSLSCPHPSCSRRRAVCLWVQRCGAAWPAPRWRGAGVGTSPRHQPGAVQGGTGGRTAAGRNGVGPVAAEPCLPPRHCLCQLSPRACAHAPQVAAGPAHTLALLEGGAVASWGDNEHGETGQGGSTGMQVELPRVVKELRSMHVVRVAAGGSHTLALSSTGGVFSCGSGLHGQLGRDTSKGAGGGRGCCDGWSEGCGPVPEAGVASRALHCRLPLLSRNRRAAAHQPAVAAGRGAGGVRGQPLGRVDSRRSPVCVGLWPVRGGGSTQLC